jgi:ATP-dependent protease ClpP protease subunit
VVCVVDGKAMSMAFYILQTCDVRLMTKRSYLMVHQPIAQGIEDSQPVPLENRLRRLQAIDNAMMQQYVKRMKISAKELRARIDGGREYYLNSDDAVKAGAVDGVVESVEVTRHNLMRP